MQHFLAPFKTKIITALVLAVLLGSYLSVLPDHLVTANFGSDGGDFLTAILVGGVAHPSGYPTYLILGRLFSALPWGSPYLRVALLSVTAAVAAGGLLYGWALDAFRGLRGASLAAVAAAVCWGCSPLIWSQAVIVEVQALHALFLVMLLWYAQRQMVDSVRAGELALFALLTGLAVGNHLTILLLAAPVLLVGVWRAQGRVRWLQAAAFALGLLVYAYLPLQARHYPAVNWGNPQTWRGFWWTVSGEPYQALLGSVPLQDMLAHLRGTGQWLLDQFGIGGVLLAVAGLFQSHPLKPIWRLALLWLFVGYLLFASSYRTTDAQVYLVGAGLAFAVWIGLGVCALWGRTWRKLPWGSLAVCFLLLLWGVRIPMVRSGVDARRDLRAVEFAENYLRTVPADALLMTESDEDTFPLWYYHYALGWRPDVRLVVLPLTQFAWYQETLQHIYPDLKTPPVEMQTNGSAFWGEQLPRLNLQRTVCRSQPDAQVWGGIRSACGADAQSLNP